MTRRIMTLFLSLLLATTIAVPTAHAAGPSAAAPQSTAAAPRSTAAAEVPARPDVRPHCARVGGLFRCGLKYTNTESKVIVAAAIGALTAGGVVACRNVVICKILVTTVGAALTTWWTAITRYDRCLFTYSTGLSTRATLVSC